MNEQPKILLIEEDLRVSSELQEAVGQTFNMQIEPSAEHAVNRVGFEDFDLVVLDAQATDEKITRFLIQFFHKIHTPVLLFGERLSGLNGYPILAREERSRFADKVCDLLGVAHTL